MNKSTSDDEIKSRLKSDDKGTVLSGLDFANNRGVEKFIKEIKDILVNFPHQSIRSFALMLLVQKKYNEEVDFNSKDGVIKLTPSKLKAPFIGEPFNRISKRMITEFKNPSISENAINIFSSYIIDIYPDDIRDEDEDIIAALYLLSCDCLQIKDIPSIEEYCEDNELNELKVKKLYNKFAKVVQNF